MICPTCRNKIEDFTETESGFRIGICYNCIDNNGQSLLVLEHDSYFDNMSETETQDFMKGVLECLEKIGEEN